MSYQYKEPTGRDTFERLSGAFIALENEIQVAAIRCGDDIDTRSELLSMIPVLQGMFRRVSTEMEAASRKEFLCAHPPSASEVVESWDEEDLARVGLTTEQVAKAYLEGRLL